MNLLENLQHLLEVLNASVMRVCLNINRKATRPNSVSNIVDKNSYFTLVSIYKQIEISSTLSMHIMHIYKFIRKMKSHHSLSNAILFIYVSESGIVRFVDDCNITLIICDQINMFLFKLLRII